VPDHDEEAMEQPLLEHLAGQRLQESLADLARLRIAVFRAYPYLYEGSEEYEQRYLQTYAADPEAVVIGCRVGGRLVGAATALPLRGEPEAVRRPLAEAGFDVERVFYFGESVLEPEFRGQGIGVRFFAEREAAARASSRYDHAVFCAVQRPPDHPAKPASYKPLDSFWNKRGFRRLDGLSCRFSWRDVGDLEETGKPMAYWLKAF
jgi:GNAT superfamily N-acetyltransferase